MANVIRIARRIVIGQNRTVWRGLSISGHKMNEVVTNEKDKQLDLYDNKEVRVSFDKISPTDLFQIQQIDSFTTVL